MDKQFLETLLQAARQITQAERALAVDGDLDTVAIIDFKETEIEDADFKTLADDVLTRVMKDGEPLITNNVIRDPAMAPKTNTNFADLRVVVGIPVQDHGGLYLDQHIRYGMVSQDVITALMQTVTEIVEQGLIELTVEEIIALYRKHYNNLKSSDQNGQ